MGGALHEENKLMEIVKLIGSDVLPDDQKLIIETAKLVRTGFLQQNAYHPADTCAAAKTAAHDGVILHLYHGARDAPSRDAGGSTPWRFPEILKPVFSAALRR